MSDTEQMVTAPEPETPTPSPDAAPTTPSEPVQAPGPVQTPPPDKGQSGGGWFSRGWRCGVAAAVIVVVAGAFFTIGWFTSTREDHGDRDRLGAITERMNLRERAFQQNGENQQVPQWPHQRYYRGQPLPGGQATPQTPPNQQTPSTQPTPQGQQTPSTQQNPVAPSSQEGYLGVGVVTATPALQEQYGLSSSSGALVTTLDRTGPAFRAGIQRGDIITSIDGTTVTTREDVVNLIGQKKAGDTVSVVVNRNGQSQTFQITLAQRPDVVSG